MEKIYSEGKNLIITPHIAGATFYSMHKTNYILQIYCLNILIKKINEK